MCFFLIGSAMKTVHMMIIVGGLKCIEQIWIRSRRRLTPTGCISSFNLEQHGSEIKHADFDVLLFFPCRVPS